MPIQDKQLTIRAADGFRPEIQLNQARSGLMSNDVLRLEGLRISGEKDSNTHIRNPLNTGVVRSRGDKLELIKHKLECGILSQRRGPKWAKRSKKHFDDVVGLIVGNDLLTSSSKMPPPRAQ